MPYYKMRFVKKNFINKRKKNILKINLYIILFLLIFFLLSLYVSYNYSKIIISTLQIIEKYSKKHQYTLSKIEISNLNFLNEKDIAEYFNPYLEKSIFLVPLNKISNEIRQIKWVKDLNIKSNYKNTLLITLEEEIPLGIYDNENQKILFSYDLVVLEIIASNIEYKNLITFLGENSLNNSKKLLIKLDNDFEKSIKSAMYIGNRRWNLKLKNKIILKLPENNINEAIENYKKIYANFSNKDLKDIENIDLRMKNKVIIKYKDDLND